MKLRDVKVGFEFSLNDEERKMVSSANPKTTDWKRLSGKFGDFAFKKDTGLNSIDQQNQYADHDVFDASDPTMPWGELKISFEGNVRLSYSEFHAALERFLRGEDTKIMYAIAVNGRYRIDATFKFSQIKDHLKDTRDASDCFWKGQWIKEKGKELSVLLLKELELNIEC